VSTAPRSHPRFVSPLVVAVAVVVVLVSGVTTSVVRTHHGATTKAATLATERTIETFVEQVRGLRARRPIALRLADTGQFHRLLNRNQRSDTAQITGAAATLTALGLVPAGFDLHRAVGTLLDNAVVGFYDPHSHQLVVRGGAPTPFTRVTMAHELTHALQDQAFNLARFDSLRDEASSAVTALIEGDAVRVEQAYYRALPTGDQESYRAEARRLVNEGDPGPAAAVLEDLLVFPYEYGPPFVAALLARGGNAIVDATFRDPPTTTEQILHPQLYFDRQPAIAVVAPPAAGKVVDRGQLGEFGLRLVLHGAMSDTIADMAAAGWGGDRYVTWRAGGRDHCAVRIAMDSEQDAIDLAAALATWAPHHPTARFTRQSAIVELTVDEKA